MQKRGDSWQVGCILRESVATTLRFAAWYLELGADCVHLMFDDPKDSAQSILRNHPKVRCVPCTQRFWRALQMEDEARFPKRQNAALSWLYPQIETDWLLNVDADEFVFLDTGSVTELLGAQKPAVAWLRIATAEIVSNDCPGPASLFRLPMDGPTRQVVYGEDVSLFGPRRQGLVGHSSGKSFVRTGIPGLRLRQHWPVGDKAGERVLFADSGAYLLHDIGNDYRIWRSKLDWRVTSSGFSPGLTAQVRAALASDTPETALQDLHYRLHHAGQGRLESMEAAGVLLKREVALDAAVEIHFGAEVAQHYLGQA